MNPEVSQPAPEGPAKSANDQLTDQLFEQSNNLVKQEMAGQAPDGFSPEGIALAASQPEMPAPGAVVAPAVEAAPVQPKLGIEEAEKEAYAVYPVMQQAHEEKQLAQINREEGSLANASTNERMAANHVKTADNIADQYQSLSKSHPELADKMVDFGVGAADKVGEHQEPIVAPEVGSTAAEALIPSPIISKEQADELEQMVNGSEAVEPKTGS